MVLSMTSLVLMSGVSTDKPVTRTNNDAQSLHNPTFCNAVEFVLASQVPLMGNFGILIDTTKNSLYYQLLVYGVIHVRPCVWVAGLSLACVTFSACQFTPRWGQEGCSPGSTLYWATYFGSTTIF